MDTSSHTVQLEDGSSVTYKIRGLRADEVKAWSTFCASIFSYKANPPPPEYFERHFENDPQRDPSLIRVAFFENDMVASVRVFLRTVSGGSSKRKFQAGGIGEVCTDSRHRKRGLSKYLLQDALEIMKARNLDLSLLHAAPTFFPVYEKTGQYECTTSKWTELKVRSIYLESNLTVRQASFPNDTKRLCTLHKTFSEERYAGCIIRTENYWNEYLSKELGDSLAVLQTQSGDILAWWSLRLRGERYQVREFGIDENKILVSTVVKELVRKETQRSGQTTMTLTMPTFIVDMMKQSTESLAGCIDFDSLRDDDDHGWMYRTISLPSDQGMHAVLQNDIPHLIWPSDSF